MNIKRKILNQAILGLLGTTTLTVVSNEACAFSSSSLGTFTGTTISVNSTTPFKAFSDYQAQNQGWVHTAKYYTLQVGTAADITNGVTYDVQFNMVGRGNLNLHTAAANNAINNPSFVIWTAGTGTINTGAVSGQGHGWNPTRGINEVGTDLNNNPSTVLTNTMIGAAGVLNGHQGWIGYVNSGPTYTLINSTDPLGSQSQSSSGVPVHDSVGNGALNTTSLTWLTNPGASSTSSTNNYYRDSLTSTVGTVADYALMSLYGLKAGNYLIALGGTCPGYPDDTSAVNACGNDSQFTFTVSTPVPVPAATWLFGGALASLLGTLRRKRGISI